MPQHTPGPFCEYCVVTENHDLIFCPLHAAAPRMREALAKVLEMESRDGTNNAATMEEIDAWANAARALLKEIEG